MEQAKQHATVLDSTQMRLGEIYAQALIGVGLQSNQVDGLLEQLASFVDDVLARLPRLNAALESPRLNVEQQLALIDRALGGNASPEFKNFLKVLVLKRRFYCLSAIRAAAEKQYNEMRGRVEAVLTTADEVDDATRQQVAEQLSKKLGKEVAIRSRLDPQIIAGMILRVGDTVYDGSVKNQLQRFRANAVQTAYQQIRDSFNQFVSD